MVLGLSLFNVIPVIRNFKSGAYYAYFSNPDNVTMPLEHSMDYVLPFDYTTDFKGYLFILVSNWYIAFICSVAFCIIDLLLLIMVLHLWGHMKILIYNMNNFQTRINDSRASSYNETYSDKENEDAFLILKDIIVYHHFLAE